MSAFWLPHACLKATRRYTSYVMDSELYRARNKYYNELMDQDFSLKNLADEIGN